MSGQRMLNWSAVIQSISAAVLVALMFWMVDVASELLRTLDDVQDIKGNRYTEQDAERDWERQQFRDERQDFLINRALNPEDAH